MATSGDPRVVSICTDRGGHSPTVSRNTSASRRRHLEVLRDRYRKRKSVLSFAASAAHPQRISRCTPYATALEKASTSGAAQQNARKTPAVTRNIGRWLVTSAK